jgi:hypothetical protein
VGRALSPLTVFIAATWLLAVGAIAQTAPAEADRQAAYCMEASFGFAERLSRFAPILQGNREKLEKMSGQPLSAADRQQITARLKSLSADIAENETQREKMKANLKVFMSHLSRRGLLEGAKDLSLITSNSAEVRKDQIAVAEVYSSCLRLCRQDDMACKKTCDDNANNSEPSKRMNQCESVVDKFK